MRGLAPARRRDDVDLERDRELVERCQQGDATAFDDLYLRYFDRLCRFCFRRLGNVSEAEDVAQEAFARAWKALPGFEGERRFYPWLSVIAANLCTDMIRRGSRTTPVAEQDLELMTAPVDGGQEEIVQVAEREILAAALDRISPRHREVLRLRESYEWSYQRIAQHQGVEVSTIETLLFRARRSLRREFMALAEAQGALAGVFVALRRVLRRAVHLHTPATGAGKMAAPALTGAGAGASGAGGTLAAAGLVASALAAGAVAIIVATTGHQGHSALARDSSAAARHAPAATTHATHGATARTASASAHGGSTSAKTHTAGSSGRTGVKAGGVGVPSTSRVQKVIGGARGGVGSTLGPVTAGSSKLTTTVSKVGATAQKLVKQVLKTVVSVVKTVVGLNPAGGLTGSGKGSGSGTGGLLG